MPKSKSAKKILQKMKDKYGTEDGTRIFYATANKQDRDPDTFKKESFKILGNLIVESAGIIIIINQGAEATKLEDYVESILANGMAVDVHDDCMIATDCEHNAIHFPELMGSDVTELMNSVFDCADECGITTNIQVMETLGTGAIAMVPNAITSEEEDEDEDEEEDKD